MPIKEDTAYDAYIKFPDGETVKFNKITNVELECKPVETPDYVHMFSAPITGTFTINKKCKLFRSRKFIMPRLDQPKLIKNTIRLTRCPCNIEYIWIINKHYKWNKKLSHNDYYFINKDTIRFVRRILPIVEGNIILVKYIWRVTV